MMDCPIPIYSYISLGGRLLSFPFYVRRGYIKRERHFVQHSPTSVVEGPVGGRYVSVTLIFFTTRFSILFPLFLYLWWHFSEKEV